jgi:hypothetical protein
MSGREHFGLRVHELEDVNLVVDDVVHELVDDIREPLLVGDHIPLSLEDLNEYRLGHTFLPLRNLLEGLVDLSRSEAWDLNFVKGKELVEFLESYCRVLARENNSAILIGEADIML